MEKSLNIHWDTEKNTEAEKEVKTTGKKNQPSLHKPKVNQIL